MCWRRAGRAWKLERRYRVRSGRLATQTKKSSSDPGIDRHRIALLIINMLRWVSSVNACQLLTKLVVLIQGRFVIAPQLGAWLVFSRAVPLRHGAESLWAAQQA